ncbi:MAG TPA: di-heme oxidoredictase family protein, partial [Chitinophagales bacterium]
MEEMKTTIHTLCFIACVLLVQSCKHESDDSLNGYESGEEKAGGATTTYDFSQEAFNHSAPNLGSSDETKFQVGNSFFKQNWVIAPSSTAGRDGLGPMYNALGCSGCHSDDGPGFVPPSGSADGVTGLLIRVSVSGTDLHGGSNPDAVYGTQFQPIAIPGVQPEGDFIISRTTISGTYADGTSYTLQKPTYTLSGNYGSTAGLLTSPRLSPPMIGLGLLEAINESDILAKADETDADGDGISGKANYVWNYVTNAPQLGRFGWKANEPSIFQQVAGAFNGDIGLTTSLFTSDGCTSAEHDCQAAPNGNDSTSNFEVNDYQLGVVVLYSQTLGVPARRNAKDATVLAGKKLFNDAGCAKCHTPSYTTGSHQVSSLSGQKIYPYTDLLLHDMGDDLADGRPDYLASGNEWRTPPLW